MKRNYWLGIDPDTRGGMALVNSSRQVVLIPFGVKLSDVHEAFATLENLGIHGLNSASGSYLAGEITLCALETPLVIPRMSRKSVATAWRFYGWVETLLYEGSFPVEWVHPRSWQEFFRTPRSLKGKERKHWLFEKARGLYPQVELSVEQADALLLAEWAMRGGAK